MTLREKELVVAAGNPGAALVVGDIALRLGHSAPEYEHELDLLIAQGVTGAACYLHFFEDAA